jgi:hypothetical protein
MLKTIKSLGYRSFVIITIAGVGLSYGIIPEISRDSHSLELNSTVFAQTNSFTDQQLRNYARAVLNMERERLATYDFIKEKAGTVPEISCYQTNNNNEIQPITRNTLREQLQGNLSQLSGSVLNQVVDRAFSYCRNAQKIVRDSGLNAQEFNNITGNWQQLEGRLNPLFMELQQ